MRATARLLPALSLLAVCLASCTEQNPAYQPDPYLPGECRAGVSTDEVFTDWERPTKVDVLFVVDDSGEGAADMQAVLADAVPDFLDVFEQADADVEVAVATTDATGKAKLAPPVMTADGCATNTVKIARSSQTRWQHVAACNVQQGEDGDPYGQPLRVVDRLFHDASPEDLGFFRRDARLLVVMVTTRDDCSSEKAISGDGPVRQQCLEHADDLLDVATTIAGYRAIPTTPEGLFLTVVAGPPSATAVASGEVKPVCSASLGSVFPGNRLYGAVGAMGSQGDFVSLCSDDLSEQLARVAERVVDAGVTICPSRKLAHEPLTVTVPVDDEDQPVPVGADGFVYLGPTDGCANGGLWFSPESLDSTEEIDVEYCTEVPGG